MRNLKNSLIALIITLFSFVAFGQQMGSNDATFNSAGLVFGTGIANPASAQDVIVLSNGKILVCGGFVLHDGLDCAGIIRLNADGTRDFSFDAGEVGPAGIDMELQSDGKIILVGGFDTINGVYSPIIARLFPDGEVDTTFHSYFPYPNGAISSISIQANGKILIAGEFASYGGVPRSNIARLNANGTLDNTFNPGAGFNLPVGKVLVQPDGNILVGGGFTTYNAVSKKRIIRLTPSGGFDGGFSIGTGFDDQVNDITLQTNGKILVSGYFYNYNGTPKHGVARLNSDGTIDNSFDIGSGVNGGNSVQSCAVQKNGKVILLGSFTSFNGIPANYIIRLFENGMIDNSFYAGSGTDLPIWRSAFQDDGKLLVCGQFTTYDEAPRTCIARINNCFGSSTELTATVCNSYELNDSIYTSSGTYIQTLENMEGCDSIVTLHLIVDPNEIAGVTENQDGSITAFGGTVVEWIDCATNMSIPNQSGNTFIPSQNGSYAVVVTSQTCTDTSDCIMINNVALENDKLKSFTISPNPAIDELVLTFSGTTADLIVRNLQGEVVAQYDIHSNSKIDISKFQNGVYFFELITKEGYAIKRVVKL